MAVAGIYMEAVAESGRNSARKHQNERADLKRGE